jgi:hypothetical protein
MPVIPTNIDVVRDVTFLPDFKGPALLVHWRGVPMGFIRPVTRIPRRKPGISPEEWEPVRQEYKKRLGKWCATLLGGGYFDTKEEAARHVVTRILEASAGMPLIQAALREDYEEVNRLLRELPSPVCERETNSRGAP